MQLDLTRYRQPVSQFGRTFQPSEVEQEGDAYRVVAPVRVDIEIHKDKDRFRLTGTAQTELELACGAEVHQRAAQQVGAAEPRVDRQLRADRQVQAPP